MKPMCDSRLLILAYRLRLRNKNPRADARGIFLQRLSQRTRASVIPSPNGIILTPTRSSE